MSKTFGTDYNARKAVPVFDGVLMYFPDAIAAVASVSEAGNKQHNPGEPLHWARGKSMNQFDTALRHMIDHRTGGGFSATLKLTENNGWVVERYDTDGVRHLAKAAWRILAALQLDIEAERAEKGPLIATGWASGGGNSIQSGDVVTVGGPVDANGSVASTLCNCACGRWVVSSLTPKFWSMAEDKMHTKEKCE